jgi:hypothetical protein
MKTTSLLVMVVALSAPAQNAVPPAATAGPDKTDQPRQAAEAELRDLRCAYLGTTIHAACRMASGELFTKERAPDYTDPRAAADFFSQVCRHAGLYARDDCAKKSQMGSFDDLAGNACQKVTGKISITVLMTCNVGINHARGLRNAEKACHALQEATRRGAQSLCDQTTQD